MPTITPLAEPTPDLGPRSRSLGVIVWSAFLAAAIATMACFAFLDPLALTEGSPPFWWTTRLQVYGIGFFFFWAIGLLAATLSWLLARSRPR